DHPHDLVERKRAHLDELGVVGFARDRAQALGGVQVRGLVEDRLRRVERAKLDEPLRLVARLLDELAADGRLLALARLTSAGRDLPAERARDVAPLADEDDGARVEERKHADARRALDDAVERRSP